MPRNNKPRWFTLDMQPPERKVRAVLFDSAAAFCSKTAHTASPLMDEKRVFKAVANIHGVLAAALHRERNVALQVARLPDRPPVARLHLLHGLPDGLGSHCGQGAKDICMDGGKNRVAVVIESNAGGHGVRLLSGQKKTALPGGWTVGLF